MPLPLVSIIVNVFNGERFIAEALDSILALDGGYPLQVIVTDDASTDGTAAILARYDDPRLEIVRLPQNVGAAAAITLAFERVAGELVARLDYDDRYHRNFLTQSVPALQRHPEAAFVCSNAMMIDPAGQASEPTGPFQYGEAAGCRDRFQSMLTRHFVTAPTILGRTRHWRRAIPVPPGMNFCDWFMNLTMAEAAPIVVLDVITADYRVHPQGMHITKIRDGMGERVTLAVLDRFLEGSPRSIELAPAARKLRARHYADWGDKYFGAGLDDHALRCYRNALALHPALLVGGRFQHRLLGLIAGRSLYERSKRIVHKLMPVR